MTELSAEKLAGLRKTAEAAHDHIGNLCTGEDRWRMTVPPRDDDSDMLFSTLADGVLTLLDRIAEQSAEIQRQHDELVQGGLREIRDGKRIAEQQAELERLRAESHEVVMQSSREKAELILDHEEQADELVRRERELRMAEVKLSKIRELTAAPPPLGAPVARWADRLLLQIRAILSGEDDHDGGLARIINQDTRAELKTALDKLERVRGIANTTHGLSTSRDILAILDGESDE